MAGKGGSADDLGPSGREPLPGQTSFLERPLTFGSLFAGIGGLDLGLERAGLVCRWQVEQNDYARRVLAKHWPSVRRWRDVRSVVPDTVAERRGRWCEARVERRRRRRSCSAYAWTWHVDVIAAGFPCQDISYAGKGAGLDGKRSGLWWETARIIRTLGPRYVLLENVSALLTRGVDRVLGSLASLGYDAEWHCLPAAYVGAPHIRDRVFILGHASGVGRDERRDDHGGDVRDLPSSATQDADRMADPASGPRDVRSSEGTKQHQGCLTPGRSGGDVAHAGRKQSERRRGTGDLACEAGASQSHREKRQRHGDAAVDRRPDAADAHRQRQQQPGGPLCEVGGRLGDFRETVGRAQWGIDPADGPEPRMGRVAHGVPNRVHRLRGLGNAVVPQVGQFWGERIVELHRSRCG